jgi:hypothetical protein
MSGSSADGWQHRWRRRLRRRNAAEVDPFQRLVECCKSSHTHTTQHSTRGVQAKFHQNNTNPPNTYTCTYIHAVGQVSRQQQALVQRVERQEKELVILRHEAAVVAAGGGGAAAEETRCVSVVFCAVLC